MIDINKTEAQVEDKPVATQTPPPIPQSEATIPSPYSDEVKGESQTAEEVVNPYVTEDLEVYGEVIDNRGMFKRVFSFKGRIRRLEYGVSWLLFMGWYTLMTAISESTGTDGFILILALISYIPAYWFIWAQSAKRCHDRGNSGWYQLIPFYGILLLFGPSDDFTNEYGTKPK